MSNHVYASVSVEKENMDSAKGFSQKGSVILIDIANLYGNR